MADTKRMTRATLRSVAVAAIYEAGHSDLDPRLGDLRRVEIRDVPLTSEGRFEISRQLTVAEEERIVERYRQRMTAPVSLSHLITREPAAPHQENR